MSGKSSDGQRSSSVGPAPFGSVLGNAPMKSSPNKKLLTALWANALLLGVIAATLLLRNSGGNWTPAALGAQPSIAGGGGIFVMPAQLAQNQWGCYLLDIDHQTLVAYQYSPSNHQLSFVAARNYRYDVQLHDYSTDPPTRDVQKLIEMENTARHNAENAPADDQNQPK